MKLSQLIICLLLPLSFFSNMANPEIEGSTASPPFVNEFVDILNEEIYIKINKDLKTASYVVSYQIQVNKSGLQIPFLFHASDYKDSFKITIDGKEIEIKDIPYDTYPTDGKFEDFTYFFGQNDDNISFQASENSSILISPNDMIYFECDLLEGIHNVEVKYIARSWVDTWEWLNDYSFRYSLSPASYWKSFQNLSISIDAQSVPWTLSTNLGEPTTGNLDSIAIWHFSSLPSEFIEINISPEINDTANKLILLGPEGLANILGILLVIVHLFISFRYRKKIQDKKHSIVITLGGLLLPLIYVIAWYNFYFLIDVVIGPHASGNHGYHIFILFAYPFIFPVYWLAIWLIDRFLFKKWIMKQVNE